MLSKSTRKKRNQSVRLGYQKKLSSDLGFLETKANGQRPSACLELRWERE